MSVVTTIEIDGESLAAFQGSLASIGEAFDLAHVDAEIEFSNDPVDPGGVVFGTAQVARIGRPRRQEGRLILPVIPGIGLPILAAYVLSLLPPGAWVEWCGGWPYFRLFPRDGDWGDPCDHPPALPLELEPA